MRALVKHATGPGMVRVENVPEPSLASHDVLIRVEAASVCGSDLQFYEWKDGSKVSTKPLPRVMGHEFSGTIVDVGKDVAQMRVGQRVSGESHITCTKCRECYTDLKHLCRNLSILGFDWDGAFAEYVRLPEWACFELPEMVSFETGALFEPAGVAIHAIQRSGQLAGRYVAILGAGPIGLMIGMTALQLSAERVVIVEPNPIRRSAAETTGITALDPEGCTVADCIRQLSDGRDGVDVLFETSGASQVWPEALKLVRRGGTAVTVGQPATTAAIDVAADLNMRALTLHGVFGRHIWDSWNDLRTMVTAGQLDLAALVTRRISLEDLPAALPHLRERDIKIIIHP